MVSGVVRFFWCQGRVIAKVAPNRKYEFEKPHQFIEIYFIWRNTPLPTTGTQQHGSVCVVMLFNIVQRNLLWCGR